MFCAIVRNEQKAKPDSIPNIRYSSSLEETLQNTPKVLVIRLSSLGDLVLSTGAIEPLRAAGYSISLVTKSEFAPLLQGHPDIQEIYTFDKKVGERAAREALFAWAERRDFAFVLDLQNSWRTWSWRRRLRKWGRVHVLGKTRLREWLVIYLRLGRWVGFGQGGRARRFRHAAERAVAAEGKPALAIGPLTSLHVSPQERDAVRSLLPAQDFAVLLPGGAWKSKEWPYFPELAKILAKKVPVVVLGGAKDQVCQDVASAAQSMHPESRSLHGRTTLRESIAIISHAKWVIGNDTGMVHVAEALGKDVAMVEGPTHPRLGFSPYRKKSAVLGLPLVCRPCSKSGKICVRGGTRWCLYGLRVADVAAQLRERGYPC